MTKKWPRDYGEGHSIEDTAVGSIPASAREVSADTDATGGHKHGDGTSSSVLPTKDSPSSTTWPVALYVPNILGYLRILLSFYGLLLQRKRPHRALNVWIAAALLDLFDGIAARRLNQCSQFGILLDIVADNILRSIVWISTMMHTRSEVDGIVCAGTVIICLEWITMVCTQSNQTNTQQKDESVHWKDVKRKSDETENKNKSPPPFWVAAVFKNNFRTPPGILAIYGLFVAPFGSFVWYADQIQQSTWPYQLLSERIILILLKISYVGRLLSAMVELWLCCDYLNVVIARDSRWQASKPKGS